MHLASLVARDNYAPHQLAFPGDRLTFSNGIILLGLLGAPLILVFGGLPALPSANATPRSVKVFSTWLTPPAEAREVRKLQRRGQPGFDKILSTGTSSFKEAREIGCCAGTSGARDLVRHWVGERTS